MEGQSTNNNTNTAPTTVVGVDSGIPTVEGLTQQLDALKASTSEWKKAVKVQLLDAQTKNQMDNKSAEQMDKKDCHLHCFVFSNNLNNTDY